VTITLKFLETSMECRYVSCRLVMATQPRQKVHVYFTIQYPKGLQCKHIYINLNPVYSSSGHYIGRKYSIIVYPSIVKYREINSGFSTKTNNLLQSVCVL
jgi:hypothetical protein